MGYISQIAAFYTDSVYFGHFIGDGAKVGHRAKWNSSEIHVESGNDNADAVIR